MCTIAAISTKPFIKKRQTIYPTTKKNNFHTPNILKQSLGLSLKKSIGESLEKSQDKPIVKSQEKFITNPWKNLWRLSLKKSFLFHGSNPGRISRGIPGETPARISGGI